MLDLLGTPTDRQNMPHQPSPAGREMPGAVESRATAIRTNATDESTAPGLGVTVAADRPTPVIRVNGDLTGDGAEMLTAITDQFVRDGRQEIRLDLADITAANRAGLHTLEQLRTSLSAQGVSLLVSNRSSAVQDAAARSAHPGLSR